MYVLDKKDKFGFLRERNNEYGLEYLKQVVWDFVLDFRKFPITSWARFGRI